MNKTEECFKEGLLKKIEPNLNFADKSIKLAEHFLEEADDLIEKEIKDMAIIANSILLAMLVEGLTLWPTLAKAIVIPIIGLVNFLVHRKITFGLMK